MFGFNRKTLSLQQNLEREMKKRKNQANLILGDLMSHKTRYTHQLERHAFNYTARISDLRKRGHVIDCEYYAPGVFKYTYRGHRPNLKVA